MTDAEQSLLALGMKLRDGIADMLRGRRLALRDIPDDDRWLKETLAEMAALAQQVKIEEHQ